MPDPDRSTKADNPLKPGVFDKLPDPTKRAKALNRGDPALVDDPNASSICTNAPKSLIELESVGTRETPTVSKGLEMSEDTREIETNKRTMYTDTQTP